ncbi:TetR/AcrR family transcriptional regulator [Leucobacter sp. G161]|uniref:TetR/AcrR family transcriptional regulator n=1 Tax=Leucobacter sp. G161 TaxID=663704 RepID=UPI000B18CB6B|nr:TetR family transcriptional regulator [Leucobacter sp. G161]
MRWKRRRIERSERKWRTMAVNEGSTARRSGRPTTAVLTRGLILETALRLLDERGESGASLREIARELGVRPSALYNHIQGQDDLISGIRELVSDRIDVSGFAELSWDAALERWARSYRNAFAAHPPTIALLGVLPIATGTRTSQMYEVVCSGLMAAGWPEEEVLVTVVAVESLILGAALDHTAPDNMLDPGDDPEAPTFRAVYAAARAGAGEARPTDIAFDIGLNAMLVGLRARHLEFVGSARAVDGSCG